MTQIELTDEEKEVIRQINKEHGWSVDFLTNVLEFAMTDAGQKRRQELDRILQTEGLAGVLNRLETQDYE